MLCCLRPCNKYLYKNYNTTCFKSCRPGENNEAKAIKKYDTTICYSESDDEWVRTKLLPIITNQGKAYKVHLMTTHHKGFTKYNTNEMEILNESKRIVLIISQSFINEEWKSENFQITLKSICAHDSDCVIIPISIDGDNLDDQIGILEEYDDIGTCVACKKQVKYSTILKNVETINAKSKYFSQNLKFLLPIMKKTGSVTITTESKNLNRDTISPFNLAVDDDFSLNQKVASVCIRNEGLANIGDNLPLINSVGNKKAYFNEDLVVPFNEPTPRERRLKSTLLNNYLKPYENGFILKNVNEVKESSRTSPRESGLQNHRQKSTPHDIEQLRLPTIKINSKIPNRTINFEIDPFNISSTKNLQNHTDSIWIGSNENTSFMHPGSEDIPTIRCMNIPTPSNNIIPVVSASRHKRDPKETNNERLKKERKKQKNKKYKKNEDYNILPINEELNISCISFIPENIQNKSPKRNNQNTSNEISYK
jgi:hypothetical protein